MNINKKINEKKNNPKEWRNVILYIIVGLLTISVVSTFFGDANASITKSFSEFSSDLEKGQIKEVKLRPSDHLILGTTSNDEHFKTYYVNYPGFIEDLQSNNVEIIVNPVESGRMWGVFIQAFLPFILIGFLWFFIFRQAQGANSQAMSFGKTRAMPWKKENKDKSVTFKDVAGVNEAVEELGEIVEFLKNSEKYKALGAKIPKGALLMGPPGTGKTLLAKAVAGEADVPFFSLSGSDFVEMFVGVGASRVRDLFKQASKNAPAIIFVDEIDAVGRHRGAGMGGGHDEREQTLNQLLVEMDGFNPSNTVIVLAATNRPDILDPALLRPGRFDRQITVDKPDVTGRLAILNIHAKGKTFDSNIDLEVVAKRTSGFTGADLANLLNEAALLTARKNNKKVHLEEIEESIDRVIAGPERKSRIISDKEKETVAYHEVGHALVAKKIPDADPVHKISILPRGRALGYTLQLPVQDKHLHSREEIKNEIQILLGGRIAEEMIFNSITSGASNDIERITALAKDYVCKYGMSENLGTRVYGKSSSHVFLAKSYGDDTKDYSEETAREIDLEINKLIKEGYQSASEILKNHKTDLINVATVLMEREVLDGNEFQLILDGKTLEPLLKATVKKEKQSEKSASGAPSKGTLEKPAKNQPQQSSQPNESIKPTTQSDKTSEGSPAIESDDASNSVE
ncbi:ATP-dependent metallopeptidase FtsH/Yme1/Tma family protein [bacterium]|jgi:cell division protease FtsH|nr:ATP-dependent metallopeptidase FtsH/Yme1/Tma family protein [bacterium]